MIAWVNMVNGWLLPPATVTVRLPAVLFRLVGQTFVFLLARRIFDAGVGFWAVAALVASPGAIALNYLMTIDALLMLGWMTALYALWHTLEDPHRWRFWIWTGLMIGFGLTSKQMMLFFPVLIFLFIAFPRATGLSAGGWYTGM